MQQTTNKEFKADGDVAQWGQNLYEVAIRKATFRQKVTAHKDQKPPL